MRSKSLRDDEYATITTSESMVRSAINPLSSKWAHSVGTSVRVGTGSVSRPNLERYSS